VEGRAIGYAMRENPISPVYAIKGNLPHRTKGLKQPRSQWPNKKIRQTTQAGRPAVWHIYGEADLLRAHIPSSFGGEYYKRMATNLRYPIFPMQRPNLPVPSDKEECLKRICTDLDQYPYLTTHQRARQQKLVGGTEALQFINHNMEAPPSALFSTTPITSNLSTGRAHNPITATANPHHQLRPNVAQLLKRRLDREKACYRNFALPITLTKNKYCWAPPSGRLISKSVPTAGENF